MANKFDKLAEQAAKMTDEAFIDKFTSLTKLTNSELDKILKETKISNEDLALLLKEVKAATAGNETQAQSILKINNGLSALVAIAKRLMI